MGRGIRPARGPLVSALSVAEATLETHFSVQAAYLGMFLLMRAHTLMAASVQKWPRGHTGTWACYLPVSL